MAYTLLTGLFLAFLLGWLGFNVACLFVNYRKASLLGLPVVIAPVSPDNHLWLAVQTSFSGVLDKIPFRSYSLTRYCCLGWEFHDRYRTYEQIGDAWILVTPARNWLQVSEAGAACEIFSRGRDFIRPVWMTEMLNVFGPNLSTAEGADWQRQRKLTATPFNEQKMNLVWIESLRQSRDMLRSWTSKGIDGVASTSDDVRTLALHVLAYTAFQQSYPFESTTTSGNNIIDDKRPMTYRDSVEVILKNILLILVLPRGFFALPGLPRAWKQVGWAMDDFREYMHRQVTEEKRMLAEGQKGTNTLVGNLVRASEGGTSGGAQDLRPLTMNEILGNIFVYNFAGHDTTTIAQTYGVFLLVAYPGVQEWVGEELRHYLPSSADNDHLEESWNYAETFPKLKRCLAVLLETLRLFNPLLGSPKYTGPSAQRLNIPGIGNVLIPPDTMVNPSLQALQTHPRYWGADSLAWRPSRWIESGGDGGKIGDEEFVSPIRGAYIAWSEGARNCPGRKFAQVEFVAAITALLRDHRADPVPLQGESTDDACKRVLARVYDSEVQLLLQMKYHGDVKVRWRKI